jgi:CRISPR-associated protein Csb2
MRLTLRQSFPLGRFHATFWKANAFDEKVAGEWPPSPWRLTRAVVARWYQWRRETTGTWPEDELDRLVRALCNSEYRFYLPRQARQSVILRQYHPVEFGWNPASKKVAGVKSYGTRSNRHSGFSLGIGSDSLRLGSTDSERSAWRR